MLDSPARACPCWAPGDDPCRCDTGNHVGDPAHRFPTVSRGPRYPSLDSARVVIGRTATFDLDDGSTVRGDVVDAVATSPGGGAHFGSVGYFVLGTFGDPDSVRTYVPISRVLDSHYDSSFRGGFYFGVD